jgi:hypothetical protein
VRLTTWICTLVVMFNDTGVLCLTFFFFIITYDNASEHLSTGVLGCYVYMHTKGYVPYR